MVVVSDLTARARIRDAAIDTFVREGFSAPLRAVADRARVSAGLVIHHFGSKAGLRAACDEQVLARSRGQAAEVLSGGQDTAAGGVGGLGDAIAQTLQSFAQGGPLLVYITRTLTEGGAVARSFLERLIVDTEASMRAAVTAGVVRPSLDEPARARYLVALSLGALTVDLVLHPPPDPADGGAIIAGYASRMMVPATEYATYGLFTDTTALDAVLAGRPGPDAPTPQEPTP
ncbi:MAG: TetR/AcrR family transcriptional regulator [Gordonia sp. (in: high G+C Gram-positive bacteria)]|nr:MAG: TetR/AcrR family transcriptional regulator [Gordonia sp. (in: high G+C Gram-positive bacteria)]